MNTLYHHFIILLIVAIALIILCCTACAVCVLCGYLPKFASTASILNFSYTAWLQAEYKQGEPSQVGLAVSPILVPASKQSFSVADVVGGRVIHMRVHPKRETVALAGVRRLSVAESGPPEEGPAVGWGGHTSVQPSLQPNPILVDVVLHHSAMHAVVSSELVGPGDAAPQAALFPSGPPNPAVKEAEPEPPAAPASVPSGPSLVKPTKQQSNIHAPSQAEFCVNVGVAMNLQVTSSAPADPLTKDTSAESSAVPSFGLPEAVLHQDATEHAVISVSCPSKPTMEPDDRAVGQSVVLSSYPEPSDHDGLAHEAVAATEPPEPEMDKDVAKSLLRLVLPN